MNSYTQILADSETIDQAVDHIKRVAYDAEVRWENVTRLGANLATVAASYLMWEANRRGPGGSQDPIGGHAYRESLEKAIEAYRTAEAGNFLPVDGDTEGEDTDYSRGWRDGEAAERSRWEARTVSA